MIIWLNGTYGAGKTTTSTLLAKKMSARIFDTEWVGAFLAPIIGDVPCVDFKEWVPWRGLTIETARQVLDFVGGTLIIPQTVLQQEYWIELVDGFATHGIPMRAITLHADRATWRERIERDEVEAGAKDWRLASRDIYEIAFKEWMRDATTVIDTSNLTPDEVADNVADLVE